MTEPECDVAGGHDLAILQPYEMAMDRLTAFGLIAVSAMLVCYAFEDRSPWWVLGFAVAWPFGMVEAIWCLVALYRWRVRQWPRSRSPG
jgi:membrane protein YdbS with pleckstrin-like domain